MSEEKLRMYLTVADVLSTEGPRADEKICIRQTPVLWQYVNRTDMRGECSCIPLPSLALNDRATALYKIPCILTSCSRPALIGRERDWRLTEMTQQRPYRSAPTWDGHDGWKW